MTTQAGRDMLIKIDMTGDGRFEAIAGLRSSRFSLNSETVDATAMDSADGWRELLGPSGVKSAEVRGAGVFRDSDADARIQNIFFRGETPEYQLIVPDFGALIGPFQITSLSYLGEYDREARFELGLASAGAVEFVAHLEDEPEPELEAAGELANEDELTVDDSEVDSTDGTDAAATELDPVLDNTVLSETVVVYEDDETDASGNPADGA